MYFFMIYEVLFSTIVINKISIFFQVVSLRTKYLALDVLETEMLPSDVIKIKFYRPPNLKYLSGMENIIYSQILKLLCK